MLITRSTWSIHRRKFLFPANRFDAVAANMFAGDTHIHTLHQLAPRLTIITLDCPAKHHLQLQSNVFVFVAFFFSQKKNCITFACVPADECHLAHHASGVGCTYYKHKAQLTGVSTIICICQANWPANITSLFYFIELELNVQLDVTKLRAWIARPIGLTCYVIAVCWVFF